MILIALLIGVGIIIFVYVKFPAKESYDPELRKKIEELLVAYPCSRDGDNCTRETKSFDLLPGRPYDIAEFGDKAIPILVDIIESDKDTWNANVAIHALGAIGSDKAVKKLSSLLSEDSPDRHFIIDALGRTKNPQALDVLIPIALGDKYIGNRQGAISALVNIGDPRAIPVFEKIIQTDPKKVIIEKAQRSLIKLQKNTTNK